jgi:hypothetical protein
MSLLDDIVIAKQICISLGKKPTVVRLGLLQYRQLRRELMSSRTYITGTAGTRRVYGLQIERHDKDSFEVL